MKNGMKRLFAVILLVALMISAFIGTALAAEADAKPAEEIAYCYMHRMYNPNTGEHFYTGSEEERDNLVSVGWQYEGQAWAAPTNCGDPVYRLYNPNSGDHHYTMSAEERDNLVNVGWQYEGVAWNSFSSDGVAHYRLYNPNADVGSHHYTASIIELNNLVNAGWDYEGIAFFGYAPEHEHEFNTLEGYWEANDNSNGCTVLKCDCGVRNIGHHVLSYVTTKVPTQDAAGTKEGNCACGRGKETAEIPAGTYDVFSGDPVYFLNPEYNLLYRVNHDGTDPELVLDDFIQDVYQTSDGRVLYDNGLYETVVYDTVTQEKTVLGKVGEVILDGAYAYYYPGSLSEMPIQHNLETGEKTEIFPQKYDYIVATLKWKEVGFDPEWFDPEWFHPYDYIYSDENGVLYWDKNGVSFRSFDENYQTVVHNYYMVLDEANYLNCKGEDWLVFSGFTYVETEDDTCLRPHFYLYDKDYFAQTGTLIYFDTLGEIGSMFADGDFPLIDSSTARKPLTEDLYEKFVLQPGNEGQKPICSTTHGAWLNIADRKADLAFLAAPTEEEQAYLNEKGVEIEMKLYAGDGLAFLANAENPVKNLTHEQIIGIYIGKITNWSEVGGPDHKINVCYRDDQSGSQRLFESIVFKGLDLPNYEGLGFKFEFGMYDIVDAVCSDPYAIGYSIMTYLNDSIYHMDALQILAVDGVEPSPETVKDGSYPYGTKGYIVIRSDEPEDSPARRLYDWFGCKISDEILINNGITPLHETE